MGTRFGLKVGGFAALVASALLVACGGGGGGGGSSVVPTAPPATLSPTSQPASGALSMSQSTSFSLGGVSNGTSNVISGATFLAPAVSGSANASVTMQASLPGAPAGITAPQIRSVQMRKGQAMCSTCTMQALAYFTFSVTANVSITQSPGVTLALPSAPPAGTAYLVVYFNSSWQEISPGLGQPVVAAATSMTFPQAPVNPSPLALIAGTNYVFAVVDVTSGAIPTPTPGGGAPLPPTSGLSTQGGFSPYDVANALNFPVQNGFDGTGKTIAIIGDVQPLQTDLAAYLNMWGLPNNLSSKYSVVPVAGVSVSSPSPGDIDEATLDVETVLGLAPGANIEFFNTQGDLSNGAFLAAETQVKNANVDVFSISFGGCEQYPTPAPGTLGSQPPDAAVFAAMAAKGTSVFASSGDQGDDCYYSQTLTPFGVNYPASDPNVVGVGGNETTPGATPKPSQAATFLENPVAWNDNFFQGGQSGTGGGVSTTFAIPSFQQGLSGAASTTVRNVPDIAMPAEGVALYLTDPTASGCTGSPCVFGGTSWSAPEAAALMVTLDEYCSGRPASPVGMWYKVPATDYVDITSGNNAIPPESVTYAAHAGYDNTTGMGVPKGIAVGQALCAGGVWTAGGPRAATAEALTNESYGEARDTVLPFAQRFRSTDDRGQREASASTRVVVVLRNTQTKASDAQTVTAALQRAGFAITATGADESYVIATAPSSTVASYFRTTMHDVLQGRYGARYANASAITVPAAIAPYVSTVMADNLVARVARPIRLR